MDCPECLFELDFLLLCEAPATPEEEAILDELPEVTGEDVQERLRPRIAGPASPGSEHGRWRTEAASERPTQDWESCDPP